MEESAGKILGVRPAFSLHDLAAHAKVPPAGLFKCRVLYAAAGYQVQFVPYQVQAIKSLLCLEANDLDYAYKYADRTSLDNLYARRGGSDEVLIIRHGHVKDTTSGNVCFLQNGRWYTPESPLLRGVMRQVLLDRGQIFTRNIAATELGEYSHCKVISAMRNWTVDSLPVENIHRL